MLADPLHELLLPRGAVRHQELCVEHLHFFFRQSFPQHPGHGLCLVPAVFLRQTAHDLLLHQQDIPQRVHAVGHRVGGLLVLRHFQPLTAGAVLGLRPVLGQIFIDPCHGFFVIARGLQPLHIIGQTDVQMHKCFVQIFHPVLSFLSGALLFPEGSGFHQPVLGICSGADAADVRCIVEHPVNMLDVIGLQGSFQLRSLPPVDQLFQQRVVHQW